VNNSPLGNTGANEGGSLAFGMEHGWNRVPATLANDDNDLALAVLIAGEAAVDTIFLEVGGFDVAAIDFRFLAFTADNAAFHLFRHRFAQLVQQAELKRADLTYEDLAERLKKHGFKETKASIANKLARATMPAAFFLACLAALELEGVALEEI
jgi:Domain of unknown function (DUF6471)